MRDSKTRYTWITVLLFLLLPGFFSNMAENTWGLQLVAWCFRIISFLLLLEAYDRHPGNTKIKWLVFPWWVLHFLFVFPFFQDRTKQEWIFACASLLPLLSLLVLMISAKKQQAFVFPMLISMLLVGLASKFQHIMGASILLVLGSSVCFYFFSRALSFKLLKAMEGFLPRVVHVTACLFMAITFIGIMFKTQHWPGANPISYLSLMLFFVSILFLFWMYLKKQIALDSLPILQPLHKQTFFCISLLSIWFLGRLLHLAPGLYSNTLPPKMEEYRADQNQFTKEGLIMEARYNTFEKNLDAFVEEIEKE
jgi:hypothetical protein